MTFIANSKQQAEIYEGFIRRLDSLRQTMNNAAEEFSQELEEFETMYGEDERERYEERYV